MATLEGTPNNDVLIGFPGSNSLWGKQGDDSLFGAEGDDRIFGNQGNDYISGNQGNDTLYGGKDSDVIQGGANDDWVFGDNGNDTLEGGQGNDFVRGGKENDLLSGNEGNDVLFGDSGADTLSGGDGEDVFVIGRVQNNAVNSGSSTLANADLIADFSLGTDLIGLDGGLQFQDLNISQGTGDFARDTIVRDNVTGEYLAILKGINSSSIRAANFTTSLARVTSTSTPSILEFSTSSYSANEGNSGSPNQVVATVQRTGSSEGAVSVQVQLDTSSTATVTEDYINNLPVTINFASGEESKTVSIPIVGDTVVELNEQINLKLVNPVGRGILGSQQTASFTIINDDIDILPTVSITVRDEAAAETGNNPATFRISRTGESRGNLTVNLAIDGSSNNPTKPSDYTLSGGGISVNSSNVSVTIPDGQSFVDVNLTAVDDIQAEAQETLKLKLADGNYQVDANQNNTTIAIAANDTVVVNSNDSLTDYSLAEGSFRQALLNANAFAGNDTITFNLPAGPQTINLTGVLPEISGDVTITNSTGSSNLTVRRDRGGFYRIFKVNSGVSATFDGLTIANGFTLEDGAGIYNDGGTVNVTNGTFSDNEAFSSVGKGGGIFNNSGTVNVTNGTFSGNRAISGGGISNIGSGAVKIANSTFSGNYGVGITLGLPVLVDGAAISNKGGTVEVTNSTLSGNDAGGGSGGGIYNGEGGTVKVTNSTLSGNKVGGFFERGLFGGGIYNDGGTVEVTNSTLSGNETTNAGSRGAGIYNKAGTVTLTNSTISGNKVNPSNKAPVFPLLSSAAGGGIWNGGTVNVKNTIVAQNTAATNPDVVGSFASGGYNLIGDATGSTGFTAVGDRVGTAAAPIDPLLNPLTNNGGPTQTLALQPASPAINGGDPAFVLTSGPFIGPPFYDQRGISPFNRVRGGIIDIGAFEFESPLVP